MRGVILLILALSVLAGGCGGPGREVTDPEEMEEALAGGFDQVGFRGFDWLTELSAFGDTVVVDDASTIKIYKRKNDRLIIDGVRLPNVYYGFYEERFCAAMVTFNQASTGEHLKRYVTATHGKPDASRQHKDGSREYVWEGGLVEITLHYIQAGTLTYRYSPIFKKIGK